MRCGSAIPRNAPGIEPRPAGGASEAGRRDALQQLLGDAYVLRGKLGTGGFADVYEAWDVRLKRSVAIKTLRADLDASPSLLERFKREAEAIAMLRHPSVIPIYAVGGDARTAYFVMPKVDGESLAAVLERERKLGADEARRILTETASALETAHAAGVVHRDIKPENILLDGPRRRVLVTDFGIAKSLGGDGGTLTGTGVAIGTPHYMSPEQAAGDKLIDHRSDQYSLAVVGYRMLSGQLPFEGESVQALIMRQIMETPRPLQDIAPDVPPAISAVLQRALQKEPAERYASTEEFLRALEDTRHVGTTTSRRLPVPDLALRVTQLRRDLAGWPWKASGAIAALVAGITLVAAAESRVALTMATNGQDAIFAAKRFVNTRDSTSGSLRDFARYQPASEAKRTFLERRAPRDIERLGRTEVPVFNWQVQLRQRGDRSARAWMVDVGPEGRIMGHHRIIHDSAAAPRISAAEAESIATSELRRFGHDPGALRRERDSTVTLEHRVDHVMTWSRPGSAIAWEGSRDSSQSQLQVRVIGDGTVASYDEVLRLPLRYPAGDTPAQTVLTLLSLLGTIVLIVMAIVTQSRHDELRWKNAFRLALTLVLGMVPGLWRDVHEQVFMRGMGTGSVSAELFSSLGLFAVVVVVITTIAAIAESLSAEHRPVAYGGIDGLLHGRYASPEFARATAHALLWAGVILLARGADSYVDFRLTGNQRGPEFSDIVTGPMRFLQTLSEASSQLVVVLLCGAGQLVVFKWLRKPVLVVAAPVLVLTAFALARSDGITTPNDRIMDVLTIALMSAAVWHSGILAAGMAFAIATVLPDAVAVARYADGGALAALASAAVVLTPLALGVVAYRRLIGRLPQGVERAATPRPG